MTSLATHELFSGSVSLSHKGEALFSKCFGNVDRLSSIKIDQATTFHTASVTKMFTAVPILQLCEKGLLNLEDQPGDYIPEYPEPYRSTVSINDLLNHTSGIELDENVRYLKGTNNANSVEELLEVQLQFILSNSHSFKSGTDYNYASEGYDLLGVITERVSGVSWAKNVEQNILDPIKMQYTHVKMPEEIGKRAIGRTSLTEDLQSVDEGELKHAMSILPNTQNLLPESGQNHKIYKSSS